MADDLKDAEPGEGHNGAPLSGDELKEKVRSLDAELGPLEAKKAEINEDIKALRRQFKKDTGLPLRRFDDARRYAFVEDDDERKEMLQGFARAFQALAPGENLDMFDSHA